jgi:hypothetical protein
VPTQAEIINDGLDELGVEHEDPKATTLANARWDRIRRAVLRDHPWNCATRRATCAQLSAVPAFGFGYTYQLPDKCLRVLALDEADDGFAWKVENGATGAVLVTDATSANVLFIYDETNPDRFDSLLCAALSARVAAELAMPMNQSLNQKQAMDAIYKSKIAAARSVDAQEGSAEDITADAWVDARFGGSTTFRKIATGA